VSGIGNVSSGAQFDGGAGGSGILILGARSSGAAAAAPTVDILTTLSSINGGQFGILTASLGLAKTGASIEALRSPGTFKPRADASVTAGTPVALWTPATGKKVRAQGGALSLSVAGQIILKDGTTEIHRSPYLAAGGIWTFNFSNGILSTAANAVLNVDVTATGNVGGEVWGTEE
jgi:hypothetical protein